jgi:hypothetical protein
VLTFIALPVGGILLTFGQADKQSFNLFLSRSKIINSSVWSSTEQIIRMASVFITRHASSTLAIAKAVGIGRASVYRVLEG